MVVEIYKILNDMGPDYSSCSFSKSNIPYHLRDDNELIQPLNQTTTFQITFFAYFGTHLWNMLLYQIKNFCVFVQFWVIDTKMVGSHMLLLCLYTSHLTSFLSLRIYILWYMASSIYSGTYGKFTITCSFNIYYTYFFYFTDIFFICYL